MDKKVTIKNDSPQRVAAIETRVVVHGRTVNGAKNGVHHTLQLIYPDFYKIVALIICQMRKFNILQARHNHL